MKKLLSASALALIITAGGAGAGFAQPAEEKPAEGTSAAAPEAAAPDDAASDDAAAGDEAPAADAGADAAVQGAAPGGTPAGGVDEDALQMQFDMLIEALSNQPGEIRELLALGDIATENVELVNVDTLLTGDNLQTLETASTGLNMEDLQSAIEGNDVLVEVLGDVEVTNLVAVDVMDDGHVVLYYREASPEV